MNAEQLGFLVVRVARLLQKSGTNEETIAKVIGAIIEAATATEATP